MVRGCLVKLHTEIKDKNTRQLQQMYIRMEEERITKERHLKREERKCDETI